MAQKTSSLLLLSIIALAILAMAAAAYLVTPQRPQSQVSSIGGSFSLTDQDGKLATDADFKDRPVLVFFGYTHCPDVCPTSLFQMSEVFKAMGIDKKVSGLFITIDPARDTPAVMKDYLSSFDPRITGLTGTPEQTQAVERAFKVYAKQVPGSNGDYTMDHTAIVYLLDKQGRFVNAFNLERTPQEAAKDLERYL